jgi:excisionase family DNA binding protein
MSTRDVAVDYTTQTTRGKVSAADFGKFYTIEQIADHMEVSTRTVRRWIKRRLLVAHQISRLVRISEADFGAFLVARRGD